MLSGYAPTGLSGFRPRAGGGAAAWSPPSFPAPAALYRFDGDGTDASGNGHNLGMALASYGPGRFAQAVVTGFGSIDFTIGDLPEYAISGWLKVLEGGGGEFGGDVQVVGDSGRWLYFGVANGYAVGGTDYYPEITSASPLSVGWHHFVTQLSGGVILMYLDGSLAGTTEAVPDGSPTGVQVTVEADDTNPADDVAYIPTTLTAEQITYLAAGNQYPG